MKLLPSRLIWRPATGSPMVASGRLCLQATQQFLWRSQHSLRGSQVLPTSDFLGKFGIGSNISQWVSGGTRTGKWQLGRPLASTNVLPLGKGGLICSGTEADGNSYSGNGGVKETLSDTFRGRGRGGSGRGRRGSGSGSFRPWFDRSDEGQKRFSSSDSGREDFPEARGRGRGRERFGNGGQWGRFSSPGRDSGDRESFRGSGNEEQRDRYSSAGRGFEDIESFRGSGNGGQREQFGGDMARVQGRGRGRGRVSYGSQREPFRGSNPGGEGDGESNRGREGLNSGGEWDRESVRGGRGRGRGNFGAVRGGGGRFRGTSGASRSPSPYYRNSISETDTSKRWDSAQRTRSGRGSFRGSIVGKAGQRGRGSYARGGRSSYGRGRRSSSSFDDKRLEMDRGQENPSISPRREQLFEGEEKWQRKVREKKAKRNFLRANYEEGEEEPEPKREGEEQAGGGEEADPEEGGQRYPQPDVADTAEESAAEVDLQDGALEIWRRKKIAWLCKEIPVLRPTGIVTILNSQRRWIEAVDTQQVMETLMRRNEILRAHRVLKWTMQQPWYENDFDLNTKIANNLGSNRKLSRMRELLETIIASGQVPDISSYVILVKAYIADETSESLDEAYVIYNQMEQLAGYQQPAAVTFSLFQTFLDRKVGSHLRHLHQADALFESMKKKGTTWGMGLTPEQWRAMYTALIHMQSLQGNEERVRALVADMREASLSLHPDCYAALIRVCAKDGNTVEAESVFKDLIDSGHKPDWRAYVALIQTYGVAGLSGKVQSAFREMEADGVLLNLNSFEALVETLAKTGDIDGARAALEKAEEKFATVLHASYNLLMEWYKSKDMLLEVEEIFNRMKAKKCRPNLQAYNNLIDSYILQGQLDKAEGVYEKLKSLQGFHPNVKTCSLMIEAFWRAGVAEKVKEVYAYLTERKLRLPHEVMANVALVAGLKKVESDKPKKLIPEQREMLVGALLGGASIASHDRNRTYEITFELGDRPHEAGAILISHLYDMFTDWAQKAPRMDVDDDLVKIHRFSTVSHGSLRFYAHQYRPEGLPVIPRLIHRWLNPLSLAYWYMYGGEKCKNSGGMMLDACQYTSNELSLVVKTLKARTIDCGIKKRRSGRVLIIKDASAVWVWKLMEPHVLDELKDLLRPDMAVNSTGNSASEVFEEVSDLNLSEESYLGVEDSDMAVKSLGNGASEVFDEVSDSNVSDEAYLHVEDSDMGIAGEVPVRAGI